MYVVSRQTANLIDEYTINTIGIPSIVLMENAGEKIFESIKSKGDKYIVFCGIGNNGGDGLVIARKLFIFGKDVKVIVINFGTKKGEEFITNLNVIKKLNIEIKEINKDSDFNKELIDDIKNSDIVVDSIFGIGLNRRIDGVIYKVIESINTYSKYVISVDTPSGIDSNSGEVLGIAIKANETYTIENVKIGFVRYDAFEYLGKVKVVYIGIPDSVKEKFNEKVSFLHRYEYKKMIPIRKVWGYKGDYGKVMLIGGSPGFSGAAYICAEAVVRSGAGLVSLLTDLNTQQVLSNKLIEAMTVNYEEQDRINNLLETCNVIACGPGLGVSDDKYDILNRCIKETEVPIILDADALNILANNKELLSLVKNRSVITPHLGEFSRLSGYSIEEIEKDRVNLAKRYALQHDVIVVLKGYNTIITDGYEVVINYTGNSKMASGGMGDCLTGIIASFVGQGMSKFKAAILACYIHGLAGDKASKDKYSVSATDIIAELPKIIEEAIIS